MLRKRLFVYVHQKECNEFKKFIGPLYLFIYLFIYCFLNLKKVYSDSKNSRTRRCQILFYLVIFVIFNTLLCRCLVFFVTVPMRRILRISALWAVLVKDLQKIGCKPGRAGLHFLPLEAGGGQKNIVTPPLDISARAQSIPLCEKDHRKREGRGGEERVKEKGKG